MYPRTSTRLKSTAPSRSTLTRRMGVATITSKCPSAPFPPEALPVAANALESKPTRNFFPCASRSTSR